MSNCFQGDSTSSCNFEFHYRAQSLLDILFILLFCLFWHNIPGEVCKHLAIEIEIDLASSIGGRMVGTGEGFTTKSSFNL